VQVNLLKFRNLQTSQRTDPATDQIGTWGLVHIKEHVKPYILSGGRLFLRGSWPFGAGVWEFPHTNFEIFSMRGNFVQERIQLQGSYAHEGSCILKRTSNYIFYQVEELIQGDLGYLVQVFVSFPTQISKFLAHNHPRIQVQTSYGHGGSCILKGTSNYIFYHDAESL